MKQWKWIASTGLVAVLAIAYVTAGTQRMPGAERSRAGGSLLGPCLQHFDGDQNGEVTRAELSQADAAFDTLDRNGDGVLTKADFPQRRHARHPGGMLAARIAKAADIDQSGDVTAAEWQALVATIETDADGAVVPESLHAVLGIEHPVRADRGDRPALSGADLTEMFSTLDGDGDGVLDTTELSFQRQGRIGRGGRDGRGGRGGADAMCGAGLCGPPSRADLDASGDVTAEEWQALFGELDLNADGTLTADELRPGRAGNGMRRAPRGSR